MSTRLVVEPEAEAELEEAATRYEDNVPGLGLAFLAELRARTYQVLEAPHQFPRFCGTAGVQCAHAIGRFPHLVVYTVIEDAVHVLAYMHPRQRPGYWAGRAKRL